MKKKKKPLSFAVQIACICIFLVTFSTSKSLAQYDLIVAQDGSGNYTTVQAAINAAPVGRTTPYVIYIKNGSYNEKITVPSTKPFLKIVGEDVSHVIISYDDYAAKLTSCTNTLGTQNSASFSVNANDFSAMNLTIMNNYGDGSQAVALLVNADRAIFLNCRLMGNQDTIYLKGSGAPRDYFKNCYIDGNVDFIFGSAIAVFDSCVIYAKTRSTTASSYITAPNTPNGQAYGFVFNNAILPKNNGVTQYFLSRPWPSPDVASTRQKAVFLSSVMSTHIKPEGWSVWDADTVTSNLYYGEYNSKYFNGSLYDVSQRVSWSVQLNATEASSYSLANIFGTWNPCTTVPELCLPQSKKLIMSNFKGIKGSTSSQFTWNATWPVAGTTYTLYKSTDNINFSPVYSTTEPTDSLVNFSYTDPVLPASGTSWSYFVSATNAGYATAVADTISISNKAAVVVNASATLNFCGFSQLLGSPSATQTFTVSGTNLVGNIIITPPSPYEVSTDNSNWFSNASPLSLIPASGTVASTTVYIRLNAAAVGTYSGSVTVGSVGNNNIQFAVSGVTFAASTSFPLQQWPLTQNNTDSAAVRSPAVTPNTSALVRLYTSDGTQPAAGPIPAYSGQYGQAFGASTAGNNWSAIGATLNRNYYEQFTVTAATGSQVRVDSITFLSDFYNTISGIKMSVVYSKNGFNSPADSTEYYNGVGPVGIALAPVVSGSFTKSFVLQRNDAGPVNRYAISLNGINGVTLNSGETITIRLYWACGSTGTPRFAYLKDVIVKGVVLNPVATQLVSFDAKATNNSNQLSWIIEDQMLLKQINVERSDDAVHFVTAVSKLPTNTYRQVYTWGHNMPPIKQYYRLKLILHDGTYQYSAVKFIQRSQEVINVYPNPANDNIIINHPKATYHSILKIMDLTGKCVRSILLQPGVNATKIDLTQLPNGLYFIICSDGNKNYMTKFIKTGSE